jgi:hypothetical protein
MNIKIDLVTFYSKGDESRFFHGLKDISAITGMTGVHRSLILKIDARILNNEMLRELIALLWRYSIALHPLRTLCKKKKFEWISDKKFYWHQNMFG